MRISVNKWFRIVFILVISLSLVANLALARNKNHDGTRSNDLMKPATLGETVINIGSVHNYFGNSTVLKLQVPKNKPF